MSVNNKMLALGKKSSVIREIFEYGNKRRAEIGKENVFDFSLGNPSIPAPEDVRKSIIKYVTNSEMDIHAYTSAPGDSAVRKKISDYLNEKYDAKSTPSLIYMTCGAAASLTITLSAILTPGDEVVVFKPFFPEYRVFVERTGATLVGCDMALGTFQIDREKLKKVINEKTKAVIVNSPNNPTGVVLTEESIITLASVLKEASEKYSNDIILISDEPYRELAYGVDVPYLTNYYFNTVVAYSFSKSMSLPGERLGYIYVSSKCKEPGELFAAICGSGRALGYVCAPSLFQRVCADCLGKTSDISEYIKNRDLIYSSLKDMGYELVKPDGAFYLFMKSPESDAEKFCLNARKYELLLVPSDSFGVGGYVRIAYCVSYETIKNSLPAFKKLAQEYKLKG